MNGGFRQQRVKVAVVFQIDDGPVQSISGYADDLDLMMDRDELDDDFTSPAHAFCAFNEARHTVTIDFGYHEVSWVRRDFEDIPDEPAGDLEQRRAIAPPHREVEL